MGSSTDPPKSAHRRVGAQIQAWDVHRSSLGAATGIGAMRGGEHYRRPAPTGFRQLLQHPPLPITMRSGAATPGRRTSKSRLRIGRHKVLLIQAWSPQRRYRDDFGTAGGEHRKNTGVSAATRVDEHNWWGAQEESPHTHPATPAK